MAARLFPRLSETVVKSPLAMKQAWDKLCTRLEEIIASIVSADATMPPLAPVTIYADYLGVVTPASQLPLNVQATRLQNADDVTGDSTWSIESETGAVTASVGANDGLIEITDAVGSDVLTITSDYLGSEKVVLLTVNFVSGAPPAEGTTGGSTASTSTFATFNSTTHAAVSSELTVTVGSNGEVQLAAPSLKIIGTGSVFGIWRQWSGGSYVDVDTEVASVGSSLTVSPAAITGLTPSTTEKFQLYARRSSGTSSTNLYGTASAVGR